MFHPIRKHLSYANVAATLALFFAMSGGALAASHYLITSTKQISPKVLKSLAGKPGPAGANGANGAQGPQGPAGLAGSGTPGAPGAEGHEGKPGANGKSATVSETAPNCNEAGVTVEVEGSGAKHEICNGEKGAQGEPGVIHPKETLASDASETGAWSVGPIAEASVPTVIAGHALFTTIASFPIPLKAGIASARFIDSEGKEEIVKSGTIEFVSSVDCKGSAEQPTAVPGNLCVYAATPASEGIEPQRELATSFGAMPIFDPGSEIANPTLGTGTTGAWMALNVSGETAYATGTWAVTAP